MEYSSVHLIHFFRTVHSENIAYRIQTDKFVNKKSYILNFFEKQ